MTKRPTTSELSEAKLVSKDDVTAAVDAFMTNPSTTTFPLGKDYALDLRDAVAASPFALGVVMNPHARPASKRNAIRTAILLARPVKA